MEFQKIPMNEYQTELTEELVNSLPPGSSGPVI